MNYKITLMKLISLFFLIIMLCSCSKYQQLLKSTDLGHKYEMAVQYYNDKEYYKAFPLFEELITLYKGTAKGEEVYYYYAYCNYYLDDYILAGYYFKNFSKTYPNSKHAEECQYMNAYCYYLNSPIPSLDQTNTYKAIEEMQLFINAYSQSDRIAKCNELIDELRDKLETKTYRNSKLYYNLSEYKAAIVAFNTTLKEFPDTKYKEDIVFLILKSNYLLASNSVESKKEERLKLAVEAYNTFIEEYPNSDYAKEAESIYENSLKRIKNFSLDTQQQALKHAGKTKN